MVSKNGLPSLPVGRIFLYHKLISSLPGLETKWAGPHGRTILRAIDNGLGRGNEIDQAAGVRDDPSEGQPRMLQLKDNCIITGFFYRCDGRQRSASAKLFPGSSIRCQCATTASALNKVPSWKRDAAAQFDRPLFAVFGFLGRPT